MTKTTHFHSDEENGPNYSIRQSLKSCGAAENNETKIVTRATGRGAKWHIQVPILTKNASLFAKKSAKMGGPRCGRTDGNQPAASDPASTQGILIPLDSEGLATPLQFFGASSGFLKPLGIFYRQASRSTTQGDRTRELPDLLAEQRLNWRFV